MKLQGLRESTHIALVVLSSDAVAVVSAGRSAGQVVASVEVGVVTAVAVLTAGDGARSVAESDGAAGTADAEVDGVLTRGYDRLVDLVLEVAEAVAAELVSAVSIDIELKGLREHPASKRRETGVCSKG